MNPQHKPQTRLLWVVAFLCATLILLLWTNLRAYQRLALAQKHIRHTKEMIYGMWNHIEVAKASDVRFAARQLFSLHDWCGWRYEPLEFGLAGLVAAERNRASREIMAILRSKAGRDLGNDPKAWVRELADEATLSEARRFWFEDGSATIGDEAAFPRRR